MYSHHPVPTKKQKLVQLRLIHPITEVASKENPGVSSCPLFCVNLVTHGESLDFSLNHFIPIHVQELVGLRIACIVCGLHPV